MIDVNLLRESPEKFKKSLELKNGDPALINRFLDLDKDWRDKVTALDKLRALKNTLGSDDRDKSRELKDKEKEYTAEIDILAKEREVIIEQIPNIPAPDVPCGKDESGNVVLREVGERTKFDFEHKDYMSLAGGLINIEKASEVSGSRFGYILGDLVILEFALVRLAMDKLMPHGFIPVIPPVMIKPEVFRNMGKIKFIEGGDVFYLPEDDLYLAASSEHTIGPFHMNDTFSYKSLPKRYMGFSTCFRREAGSYGKDTKGILRVHQFDKVEMFSFCLPENSEEEHKFLVERQEELMQTLKLPYQTVAICTGDMGFGDYRQIDIETWMPSQGKYRETNSASNTTDFQARGINVKYKDKEGKKNYVHTLNATAFAIGRMLIAIIENYQTEKGAIIVPEALRKYVGKSEISAYHRD